MFFLQNLTFVMFIFSVLVILFNYKSDEEIKEYVTKVEVLKETEFPNKKVRFEDKQEDAEVEA